jgi:hypothetical protein
MERAINRSAPQSQQSRATELAETSRILRVLSAPIFVVGLEWTISGANKIVGNFIGPFPAYVSSLQAQHIFLPGLSLAVQFPLIAARVAIVIACVALTISALAASALWTIVGSPPFWLTGNGYASAWPVEFFLICISAALVVAIALADPEQTLVMRARRYWLQRKLK